jgi:hypothetical protein
MLISFFKKIQLPFHNTYRDIWEYQKAFLEGRIDFHRFIGAQCPLCGKGGCYRQIKEYYRFAIELFPFKKEKVPIARLLCKTTLRTFSLLPHQLIPYCQYTLAAMTQTLLRVHEFQQAGYKGFHHAAGELHPDCDVSPWLVYRWLSIFIIGFRRAHHLLSVRFALWDLGPGITEKKSTACIMPYLSAVAADKAAPLAKDIISVVIWYGNRTKSHLFGTPSCQRPVKKS